MSPILYRGSKPLYDDSERIPIVSFLRSDTSLIYLYNEYFLVNVCEDTSHVNYLNGSRTHVRLNDNSKYLEVYGLDVAPIIRIHITSEVSIDYSNNRLILKRGLYILPYTEVKKWKN